MRISDWSSDVCSSDLRAKRTIAGALASAERAKTLVQRLLAFARRQPLKPVAVDVAALVQGMADLIETTAGPQIEVRLDVRSEERRVGKACASTGRSRWSP